MQKLCEKYVPTECLIASEVPSGQKFQFSSAIRVLRNKIINVIFRFTFSSIHQAEMYLSHFPGCSPQSSSTSTALPQAKTAESLRDQWPWVFSHIAAISPHFMLSRELRRGTDHPTCSFFSIEQFTGKVSCN